MAINPKFIPELVDRAKAIPDIKNWQLHSGMCGCMGPSKGEYLCPCAQLRAIRDHKVEIVAHYDEDTARQIMLQQIVDALPG